MIPNQERTMTEYRFHASPSAHHATLTSIVTLNAESPLHGAALALRHFRQLGCDIAAPLAHLDVTDPNGVRHTLLVEEVLDWLNDPNQTAFSRREGLEGLL